MERGPILRTVASLMFPFMVVLTFYLLLSGHNRAGGGFIAGILMGGALTFQYLAYGFEEIPAFLRLPYRWILAVGLLISTVVGLSPLLGGFPFLTGFHASIVVPIVEAEMEFALAQAFDFGIFLLVVGGIMTVVLALRTGK